MLVMECFCSKCYHSSQMKINIVLFQPEIPQNTGNIARTCSATACALHLIHPLGFSLDEKHLRRAGLDYWDGLEIYQYENDEQFFALHGSGKDYEKDYEKAGDKTSKMFFLSQKGGHSLWDINFAENKDENGEIWLCFGRESRGLDETLLEANLDKCVRIPMLAGKRSLNLSNAVAVTVYEVLRQLGGLGLKEQGKYGKDLAGEK